MIGYLLLSNNGLSINKCNTKNLKFCFCVYKFKTRNNIRNINQLGMKRMSFAAWLDPQNE